MLYAHILRLRDTDTKETFYTVQYREPWRYLDAADAEFITHHVIVEIREPGGDKGLLNRLVSGWAQRTKIALEGFEESFPIPFDAQTRIRNLEHQVIEMIALAESERQERYECSAALNEVLEIKAGLERTVAAQSALIENAQQMGCTHLDANWEDFPP